MLRFRSVITGADKVRSFVKLIESAAHFTKEYTIVTITPNAMSFFRASDTVRVESMFELRCYPSECFTEFVFEMGGESVNQRLSFDISTTHLVEALLMQIRADELKISIAQVDGVPILRLRNPGQTAVQDIGIEFHSDVGPDDYTISACVQESLTVTIQEASKLNHVLSAFKKMENRIVTIIASSNNGEVSFKARTSSEIRSIVKLREMSVRYRPPIDSDLNFVVNEMSVTVNLNAMQNFCRAIPVNTQIIELQIVNNTALRVFVHRLEGLFTMYLPNHESM